LNRLVCILLGSLAGWSTHSAELRVTTFTASGTLSVTNAFSNGVVTVERASSPAGPWLPETSTFSLGPVVQLKLPVSGEAGFFRVLGADLSGLTDPWTFQSGDIIDLPSLANRLTSPSDTDGVSQYLGAQLSPSTVELLFSYGGGPDGELEQALTGELNGIMQSGPLYDADRFAGVPLSPSTKLLLGQSPQGAAEVSLNRLLLEDAYPEELRQKRSVGFTNLVDSYGLLSTVAGSGNIHCVSCNGWEPSFEGGPATNATLSSPHIAMADRAGNIYIADKRAHGIRKVTPDGNIFTVAGTSLVGYGDTNPAPATSVALNNPNGLWVRQDGTFYILDRDNGLIRKVDTNGIMTTIVDNGTLIPGGRGLWVSPDESQIFFSAGTQVKSWDRTNGLTVFADGFQELGNLAVDPDGNLVVTDSNANQVYRLGRDGARVVIAGNGGISGGGDGRLAVETGLDQVRAIWFLPTGAYFLGTDVGSQVWYVDTDAHIHLFLDGSLSATHLGDGSWFYNDPTTPKVSNVRQMTMDYDWNLLITENNAGYVRKVQFSRLEP